MKISVCMATYNGEKFLEEQLSSILGQIKPNDEVVISDDGSTDKTIQIINSFKDQRIKLHLFSGKDLVKNFENALKNASGEIIFLADQDDIWPNKKVFYYLKYLKKHILVFSNAIIFSNDWLTAEETLYSGNKLTGFTRNFRKNNYVGATMAFQATLLKYVLPFPKNIPMHDSWIGLNAELRGKPYYIETPMLYYRKHGNNASTTGEKSKNSLWKIVGIRCVLLYALAKNFIKFNE